MTTTSLTTIHDVPEPSPEGADATLRPDALEIGQWFWVTVERKFPRDGESTHRQAYCCLTYLGSNYAFLVEPRRKNDHDYESHAWRVHFDDFYDQCVWDPNAEGPSGTIAQWTVHHQSNLNMLMGRMQEITSRLGVGLKHELTGDNAQALSTTLSGQSYGEYKTALVKAQKDELPAVFKQIEAEHEQLAKWMSASLLPLQAQITPLAELSKQIEGRIFNVELYAGLIEQVVKVKDGEPAELTEPLTMFQRRHYMDETCLAEYRAGGMQFKHLEEFDAWIAKDENMRWLLPFKRCMVAFRVRRYDIQRECQTLGDYIQLSWEREQDRKTYLYIRNGEQLYRLSTGIDFGEHLFPDNERNVLASGKKLWAVHHRGNIETLITDDDYQERKRLEAQRERDTEARYRELMREPCTCEWRTEEIQTINHLGTPDESHHKGTRQRVVKECKVCDHLIDWGCHSSDPAQHAVEKRVRLDYYMHRHFKPDHNEYAPFDKTSVWYDDMVEWVKDHIEKHNRVVLVVQGLLDRSLALHPHPPWQLWTPEGFQTGVRLIYDDDRALAPGEAPDFNAYWRELNASLKPGCFTIGQRDLWHKKRREDRDDGNGRTRNWWKDEGPGLIHTVKRMRGGRCVYEYTRESSKARKTKVYIPERPGWYRWKYDYDPITVKFEAPADKVFNISAYRPGDYKRFFADPRTRANYLRWAPFMLEAENWYAKHPEELAKQRSTASATEAKSSAKGATASADATSGSVNEVKCEVCGEVLTSDECEICGHWRSK